jgi:hypothetical protein
MQLKESKFLVDDFKNLPGSNIFEELKYIKGGTLTLVRQTELLNIFSFSCKFQLPRPIASKSVSYADYECQLWQQRQGNIVATINAPKKLARIAVALLSHATQGDPLLIRSVELTRSDFLSLKDYILSRNGDLRQLILWGLKDVSSDGARIKQFRLAGSRLQKLSGFEDLVNRSTKIQLFGFAYKPNAESRELTFRLISWGGGQLYSPSDPLDNEFFEFLDLFNKVLIHK